MVRISWKDRLTKSRTESVCGRCSMKSRKDRQSSCVLKRREAERDGEKDLRIIKKTKIC